jgi:hypothetical protein
MFGDFGKFITQKLLFKSHKTLCPPLKLCLNKNSKTMWELFEEQPENCRICLKLVLHNS